MRELCVCERVVCHKVGGAEGGGRGADGECTTISKNPTQRCGEGHVLRMDTYASTTDI